MLVEVNRSKDQATGLARVAEIVRRGKTGTGFHHPVLDWLQQHTKRGPALIFDITRIKKRMAWLSEQAGSLSIDTLVAVKSCPQLRYLETAHKHLDGFDVSNPAEYACLPDDLVGKLVSVTSPDLDVHLKDFVAKGNTAVVALDSRTQLERYFSQAPGIPYLLRVQGCEFLGKEDTAYHAETRFGFTIDEIAHLLQQPELRACPPSGFHVHHGSERNSVSTYRSIIGGLKALTRRASFEPVIINLGGGWHCLDHGDIASLLAEARRAFPAPCTLVIEPGQWYGKDAGFAVGTIVNQMTSTDTLKYVLNLSRACHLQWSGIKLLYSMAPRPRKNCAVQFLGATCYEGDSVGRFLLPYGDDFSRESGFAPGRQVIFSGVSLYSAAWNTSFNGIPKAEVVWWNSGQAGE